MLKRYSKIVFPSYAFLPGRNAHPLKVGGHMFETGEPSAPKLASRDFATHEYFLYAIDLFNYEYYWECHTYLEAIWNANLRIGNESTLCKAIIKLAAGFIKFKQDDLLNARLHIERARELFSEIDEEICCGIEVKKLMLAISHMLSEFSKPLPQITIQIVLKF